MRDCQQAAQTSRLAFCVRDTQGAQQSDLGRTERKRSPEQPGPQGNAQIKCLAAINRKQRASKEKAQSTSTGHPRSMKPMRAAFLEYTQRRHPTPISGTAPASTSRRVRRTWKWWSNEDACRMGYAVTPYSEWRKLGPSVHILDTQRSNARTDLFDQR